MPGVLEKRCSRNAECSDLASEDLLYRMECLLPKHLTNIERRVCKALRGLPRREPDRCWLDGEWTREVKDAVGSVGKALGYKVYANRCKFRANGEWLYDMTWVKEDSDGKLADAPLVMESEWRARGILDDFMKLLVARSQYRVMVFPEYNHERAKRKVSELVDHVSACALTRSGDRYLFACWLNKTRDFVFDLHIAR